MHARLRTSSATKAILALLCGYASLYGQAVQLPWSNVQFTDGAGHPLAGGKVYTCAAGQSCPGSPLATFTTSSGFTQNQNPITLDGSGRASIWLSAFTPYRLVVTTSAGAVIPGEGGDNIVGALATAPPPATSPGAPAGSVQFNGSGFSGSPNFTWDNVARQLTVTGVNQTASIVSATGFMQSAGGFLSSIPGGSTSGFNSASDGATLKAYGVSQASSNTNGGYIDFAPITYNPYNGAQCIDQWGNVVQQPVPLAPLTNFGTNDSVLWVGTSPSMPDSGSCGVPLKVNLDYGLNTNTYFFARGGLNTDQPSFNSIQSLIGGVTAVSFTAGRLYPIGTVTSTTTLTQPTYLGGYVQIGHSNGPPAAGTIATVTNPLTNSDGLNQGTMYWDDNLNCVNVYDGMAWACLSGGGGSGTPGGGTTNVQYNNAGAFAGNANFTWNNTNRLLTVTALDNAHAGIAVAAGFVQADQGFIATPVTCVNYNCFQAPSGGMTAQSFTATKYVETGSSAGAPTASANETGFPHPGTMYCDTTSSPCTEQLWNGSAWIALATGGATSPGGATTNVQFNSAGSFAGTPNFTWDTAAQSLGVIGTAGQAGITVGGGAYFQANGTTAGFNAPTATTFNTFQAPSGGVSVRSVTASTYTQLGNYSSGGFGSGPAMTGSDTPHPGAASYDTSAPGLRVFDGSTWNLIGSGGGSAAGPATAVQFNSGSGFAGSTNFTWNNASQLLTVNGISASAGIVLNNSAIVQVNGALGGFNAPTATQYNAFQAPAGGMSALSFTARNYIETGFGSGAPTSTSGDSGFPHPGAMYWDTSLVTERVWNGSSWSSLAGGGGVASLNGLTGALSITNGGMPNAVIVSPSGSSVALTLPQQIGTSNSVTFLQSTSTNTGGLFTFSNSNFNFWVTGNGVVNVSNSSGAYQLGGSNVIDNTAHHRGNTYVAGYGSWAGFSPGTLSYSAYNTSGITVFWADGGGRPGLNGAGQVVVTDASGSVHATMDGVNGITTDLHYYANGQPGISRTINVGNGLGGFCSVTFTLGIVTGSSC